MENTLKTYKDIKQVYTTSTRLNVRGTDFKVFFDSFLVEYNKWFREIFNVIKCDDWDSKTESKYRASIQKEYGITKRMAGSLIRAVKGRLEALKENKKYELRQLKTRLKAKEVEVVELTEEINFLKQFAVLNRLLGDDLINYRKKKKLRYNIQKVVRRLKQSIDTLENNIGLNKYSICWGDSKFFKKQYNLKENGFKSHNEWLQAFRLKRDSEFNLTGSKDEVYANSEFRLVPMLDGTFTLEVRIPGKYHDMYGKYLKLYDLDLKYRKAEVLHALGTFDMYALNNLKLKQDVTLSTTERNKAARLELATLKETYEIVSYTGKYDDLVIKTLMAGYLKTGMSCVEAEHKALSRLKELKCQASSPLTYRLRRVGKKYYLDIIHTVTRPGVFNKTRSNNGVIGLDFNKGFIALAELNGSGNLVGLKRFELCKKGSSTQKLNAMRVAASRIVSYALEVGKDIIIEDLEFKNKKSMLKKGYNKKYNKMLSELEYSRFTRVFQLTAFREGVLLRKVFPANTSYIGYNKYGVDRKLNIHDGAAYVIGRLGMSYDDVFVGRKTYLSKWR